MTDLQFDTGLPADVDAERTILGAILLENSAHAEAVEKLEAEDFALDSHRRIFLRMTELMERQQAVDIVTLSNLLRRRKEIEAVGGTAYLASLTEGLPLQPVITDYVAIVKDKSLLRRLMAISTTAISRAADQSETALDVMGSVAEQIQQASERGISNPLQTFGTFIEKSYASIDGVFETSARAQGLPSGLAELDELTCGFQRGELIVIAARPGLGKTSAGLCFARHASMILGKTSAFFSLEMRKVALLHRLVAMSSNLSLQTIREGLWTGAGRGYAMEALGKIIEAPLYIDDQPGQSVQKMRAKASRLKAQTGHLDLIVIDQLNHVAFPPELRSYGNRSQDLGIVTKGLKAMAFALDVPVVLLHQLNRNNEKRDMKEPWLSDLKDSGSVEEDSDMVIFPHRQSYYDRSTDDKERRKAMLIVAKQRNGPTGRAACEYIAEQCLFRDIEQGPLW